MSRLSLGAVGSGAGASAPSVNQSITNPTDSRALILKSKLGRPSTLGDQSQQGKRQSQGSNGRGSSGMLSILGRRESSKVGAWGC